MSSPLPPTAPPRRRPRGSDRSRYLMALYALFGIGVFVLLGGAAAVYLFLDSEQGQQIVATATRGLELVATASSAPGTEELRNAGCEVAMVDSADSVIDVIVPLLPDEATKEELLTELEEQAGRQLEGLVLVFCTVPQFHVDAPECSELARVYGAAIEFPPDVFVVVAAQQGRDEPLCNGLYTPSGQLRRSFGEWGAPPEAAGRERDTGL